MPEGLRPSGTPYFLSVPHSSYILGRARPILTSPLALSSSLHSRRHHRKLRTSFPRGGCPIEKFNQLDRRKTFPPPDLTDEQAASSSTPLSSFIDACMHACVRACVPPNGWRDTHGQSRSPASYARTRLLSTPTRTLPEY